MLPQGTCMLPKGTCMLPKGTCMLPKGTSYMGSLKSASQYGSAVWPAIANKYTNKQINIDSKHSKTL